MNTQNSNTIGFNRWFGMMCVWGVAALIALTASSAEAAGLNVNSDVTFTPLPSTYTTTTSTTGCPAAFSGKFTFTALLTNKTGSPAMPGLTVRVVTLTNGNLLLDPQTNAVLGGEGAEMTVPKVEQYADGLLSPGESVNVPFVGVLKDISTVSVFRGRVRCRDPIGEHQPVWNRVRQWRLEYRPSGDQRGRPFRGIRQRSERFGGQRYQRYHRRVRAGSAAGDDYVGERQPVWNRVRQWLFGCPRSARTAVSWRFGAQRAIWWRTISTVPATCSCGICSWGRLRW